MSTRIALIGAQGRMGRYSDELVGEHADFQVVCRVTRDQNLAAELERTRPDIGLDFTRAGLGSDHGVTLLRAGTRPLIGTSGMQPEDDHVLHELALELGLGGLVVPNFSVGVWLQQKLALLAAQHLDQVEILEEHHIGKTDSPSGTAVDTASQLSESLGCPREQIPIHSIRLPGLYSNQTVLLGGPGQILRLTHETYGLEAFGPGILAALSYLIQAPPGVQRGIGHALENH
jgi:4-hydroxy-tetrahydrodipicolinate reductase